MCRGDQRRTRVFDKRLQLTCPFQIVVFAPLGTAGFDPCTKAYARPPAGARLPYRPQSSSARSPQHGHLPAQHSYGLLDTATSGGSNLRSNVTAARHGCFGMAAGAGTRPIRAGLPREQDNPGPAAEPDGGGFEGARGRLGRRSAAPAKRDRGSGTSVGSSRTVSAAPEVWLPRTKPSGGR